eukprot:scpid107282/ scgid32995/ 
MATPTCTTTSQRSLYSHSHTNEVQHLQCGMLKKSTSNGWYQQHLHFILVVPLHCSLHRCIIQLLSMTCTCCRTNRKARVEMEIRYVALQTHNHLLTLCGAR